MYAAGLVLFPAYKQWPRLANDSKWLGPPLMAAGLIGASFVNTVNQLVITQGGVYALGGCLVYYPTLLYIDEWFVQRKGMAFGVMWASLSIYTTPSSAFANLTSFRLEPGQQASSSPSFSISSWKSMASELPSASGQYRYSFSPRP